MIDLPSRPDRLRDHPVAAWSESVVIPTYPVPAPDRNPLFLEKRVYQGSSGRVYPLPVTDRVSDEQEPVEWQAIHLENEYLRVMVLPQIGGRIHILQDRSTGYDLFYRQNVIKPALVGLLGPWLSGGLEFNWPQHHRPTTFMPTDSTIEELPDGGAVVWCSEHEPMQRMKGMHGVTLRPDTSLLEVQVRLTNRTRLMQTFLWWANVAVRVHDDYEAFFPPDVSYVTDHAKRAVSAFPVARGHYYGVDYGSRDARDADLRWYRNIPVPTSYMAMGSRADFFGGYDHAAGEGYVHWADHAIAPGKKLWTWGNGDFGQAWDRELTDEDGPYVELMAGVYTDNQPDFSFLMPGEVRTFRQFWYPIQEIGPAHHANLEAAAHLAIGAGRARLGVAVTRARPGTRVRLEGSTGPIMERVVDLAPESPFAEDDIPLPRGTRPTDVLLLVEHAGLELLRYRPTELHADDPPPPATEPLPPSEIESLEELYLTGLHLSQYRHATRSPEEYFREVLERDPADSRANTALGEWHLRRGELDAAEHHLRCALERLGARNPNPRDGEPSYLLGEVLRLRGELDGADDAYGKAGWNGPFQAATDLARAEIAARRGDDSKALGFIERAMLSNATDTSASALRAALLRRAGRTDDAREVLEGALRADPLDVRALHERALLESSAEALPGGSQVALDVAHDEARAGLLDEAIDVLRRALRFPAEPGTEYGVAPLVCYTLGWLLERQGDHVSAADYRQQARSLSADHVFPARLEEIAVLQAASDADPTDPRAPYYLGNLFYDRRRYDDAIRAWRRSAKLDSGYPTVHRNLGLAEYNVLGRPGNALAAYRRAFRCDPSDARVLYELDQLRKRVGHAPSARLRSLRAHAALVTQRDDLAVEFVTLLNRARRHEEAIAFLSGRRFHPWEGGEGLVSRQWVVANRELALGALRDGRHIEALEWAEATLEYPHGLGEGKHLLSAENELHLLVSHCRRALARGDAPEWLEKAAQQQGDPDTPAGDGPFWQAAALRELGHEDEAERRLRKMLIDARVQGRVPGSIPYFATSLPTMLLFKDDVTQSSHVEARYLEGLALLGLRRRKVAATRFEALAEDRPEHLEAALRLEEIARR